MLRVRESTSQNHRVFFSKGCPNNLRTEVKHALNRTNESLSERYLGMPSDVGNCKNEAFKFLKDRVWNKVKGWMEKLLSAGEKEVLIKSLAHAFQSTPCHVSDCPAVFVNTLTRLLESSGGAARTGNANRTGFRGRT